MGFLDREETGLTTSQAIKSCQESLKEHDFMTYSHCQKVAQFSFLISGLLGLEREEMVAVYHGALVHDMGKLAIPIAVLNKVDRLTREEWLLIKDHPIKGVELLNGVFDSEWPTIRNVTLYHHERFDGMGYPLGLKGEEIPLAARIVSVADALDAMTTYRPYRETGVMSMDEALAELEENAGSQFDPVIVKVFVKKLLPYVEKLGGTEEGALTSEEVMKC